jgi:hypothetical protein
MSRLCSFAVCGFTALLLALTAQASGDDARQLPRQKVAGDKPQGKERIPAQRKDPEQRAASASAGASIDPAAQGGTDLGAKADKEDEEFRKKQGKRAR